MRRRFPFWEDVRKQSLADVWRAILTQEVNWDAEVSRSMRATHGRLSARARVGARSMPAWMGRAAARRQATVPGPHRL